MYKVIIILNIFDVMINLKIYFNIVIINLNIYCKNLFEWYWELIWIYVVIISLNIYCYNKFLLVI